MLRDRSSLLLFVERFYSTLADIYRAIVADVSDIHV